jgi:hypothetical protein
MSASTTVHNNESSRTAASPGTTPPEENVVASPLPTQSLLNLEHQSTDNPESPAGRSTALAGPGIEESRNNIPLPGSIPEPFLPAYDYLGKVKELADEIGPDLYEEQFGQRFTHGRTRIGLYTPGYLGVDMKFEDVLENIPNLIWTLQTNFYSASITGPTTVLIVQAINKAGVQAIGTAFNVDPCFFARHLWSKEKAEEYDWTVERNELIETMARRGTKQIHSFARQKPRYP